MKGQLDASSFFILYCDHNKELVSFKDPYVTALVDYHLVMIVQFQFWFKFIFSFVSNLSFGSTMATAVTSTTVTMTAVVIMTDVTMIAVIMI